MSKNRSLSSPTMLIAVFLYRVLNYLLLGPLLIYLWLRGKRDPLYKKFIAERFGFYNQQKSSVVNPVWVHAVSLGELRSAVPLINALLEQGEHIVTTHFTPAGRREACRVFTTEIAAGSLTVVYVPLETHHAFSRFYKHFNPKYGLVMEVEFWPCMILSAKKFGLPLFLCNGQYPTKSFDRDTNGLGFRASIVQGFAGVMVKSDLQAKRFASLGQKSIAITGELRFEQPIPAAQISKGQLARKTLQRTSAVAIASAVVGEDETYIKTILAIKKSCKTSGIEPPLFIYVPRAPERFDDVKALLDNAGLITGMRSDLIDDQLNLLQPHKDIDVLVGNSMGEMYFYLSIADCVIVGGGFTPHGAHNISEAFALSKPVLVGPSIWTIEYPALEAIEAGVLFKAKDQQALLSELTRVTSNPDSQQTNRAGAAQVDQFFAKHTGAINKTLTALPRLLASATNR